MTRIRRYDCGNAPVFVTVVTHDRCPWLGPPTAKRALIRAFQRARLRFGFRNMGFVILDDHLHWLVRPGSGMPDLVGAVKQSVAWDLADELRGRRLWQRSFHDHIIRDHRDLKLHLEYIHFNPVKHGYARMPCQYRWSSFGAWVARGVYDKTWGASEPAGVSGMWVE